INLLTRILIALILGVFAGVILGENTIHIKIFGDIFLRLLNMIVLPIIAFSLIVGAASVSPKKLGSIGIKVFLFYIIMTSLSVIIGLVVSLGLHIGGLEYLSGGPSSSSSKTIEVNQVSFIDTLLQIFPTNIFKSLAEGQVLPVIFFSLLVGIALSILKENSNKKNGALLLFNIFESFVEIIYKIVEWILEYAPIGVFALIAYTVGSQGVGVLKNLIVIISVMYLALILLAIIIYAPLLHYVKCSPIKFFSKAKEAIITAFVTRSSSGTLPISMDVADKKLGVSKSIYSFSLPIGATMNMDGTVIYLSVCAVFISTALNIDLLNSKIFVLIIVSTLAAIGTAGVPGAGLIMLVMVLNSLGLSLNDPKVASLYTIILGADALMDMGRTCINVTGDLVGTVFVGSIENEIDRTLW
ncbi:MAG: dicarboxylate/amino acid:cation symporter, partial [Deferribacterota bacterium]|nr:dicarboxylate/amino acid:cation symporter [Deferribacterota bacterium]